MPVSNAVFSWSKLKMQAKATVTTVMNLKVSRNKTGVEKMKFNSDEARQMESNIWALRFNIFMFSAFLYTNHAII